VLARANRPASWQLAREALAADVADIQGGTTREGLHIGAMAGTMDLVQRCYTGIELRGDVLWINPRLPAGVRRLGLLVRYRGHTLELTMTPDALEVPRPAGPLMKTARGSRTRRRQCRRTFPLRCR
jgi:trehalose/maltose hydrolase-like predicted phosphorylase